MDSYTTIWKCTHFITSKEENTTTKHIHTYMSINKMKKKTPTTTVWQMSLYLFQLFFFFCCCSVSFLHLLQYFAFRRPNYIKNFDSGWVYRKNSCILLWTPKNHVFALCFKTCDGMYVCVYLHESVSVCSKFNNTSIHTNKFVHLHFKTSFGFNVFL